LAIENSVVAHRLTRAAFDQLRKKLLMPFVSDKTTDLQAGFMLGIQHTLTILEQEYVVGS